MDKDFFRSEVKLRRDLLDKELREYESREICKKVRELQVYKDSKKILSFMNFGSEIEIEILNREIIRDNKRLFLPRVEKNGILSVVEYGKGFTIGKYGIREPLGEEYLEELDLIIVPGLVFDKGGNRIGYGKGYYDRLFLKYPEVIRVAPIFDFQLYDRIPTEEHDKKIDIIVKKNRVLKIKRY